MNMPKPSFFFLLATFLFQLFSTTYSIGVVYSTAGDKLPPPAQVAQFLKDKTTIDRVKLLDTNPDVIRAFAGTNISVIITMANADIPKMRSPSDAKVWVDANVIPYYPKTKIAYVALGDEVLQRGPKEAIDMLTKAHKYTNQAIVLSGIYDIKVSTPHSLDILLSSEPPSQASFKPGMDVGSLAPLLMFCQQTRAPFMVKLYPHMRLTNLGMSLFMPNPGSVDKATGKTYTNTFDMLMDSVHTSMKKLGYPEIEIMVAETGWPSLGDPSLKHANVENAVAYDRGLIKKVTSGEGTPLMPGKTFQTYISGLFEENQKKGFGLFKPDFSPALDVGLMR